MIILIIKNPSKCRFKPLTWRYLKNSRFSSLFRIISKRWFKLLRSSGKNINKWLSSPVDDVTSPTWKKWHHMNPRDEWCKWLLHRILTFFPLHPDTLGEIVWGSPPFWLLSTRDRNPRNSSLRNQHWHGPWTPEVDFSTLSRMLPILPVKN